MVFQSFAFDAKKAFRPSTAAEVQFNKALRKIATMSGHLVGAHTDGATILNDKKMMAQLLEYSELIGPWATRQSEKLLHQVSEANKRAFFNKSRKISEHLRLMADSAVGQVAFELIHEQVGLIKSLPLEAGLRAQRIAAENILQGTRAAPDPSVVNRLIREMGMSEEVAVNRAKLIAITETARANAYFTQARSQAVGAMRYRWHTTMDGAERPAHAAMNKKIVEYSSPPHLKDGTTGHAGTFPRCRCWQEPIFDDEN